MSKISGNIEEMEMEKIRRQWSAEDRKWYLSVVDVIGLVTNSADARNYWKVLKNRLKNTHLELVTECNQLKMKASDGKFYLTDTFEPAIMLRLIKLISPVHVSGFKEYFDNLGSLEKSSYPQSEGPELERRIEDNEEAELTLDAYETVDRIVIKAMIAGVPEENILVSVNCRQVTVKGERIKQKNSPEDYVYQELYWGKFSRTVELPNEINIDSAVATLSNGLLSIKLKKIDKSLVKIIEIKTV